MEEKLYYAKSRLADGTQPTVKQHLKSVSELAQKYGSEIGLSNEALLAGLFHDFGKYSDSFQGVLQGTRTSIDHAICGASMIKIKGKSGYQPVIEAVNGHHSGLISFGQLEPYLTNNLRGGRVPVNEGKTPAMAGPEEYQRAYALFQADFPDFHFLKPARFSPTDDIHPEISNLESMLRTRMLFSCLVDADYSISAKDKDPAYLEKTEHASFDPQLLLDCLLERQKEIQEESTADRKLNQIRNQLFEQCGTMGEKQEGLFTLTAPTGTGKTLALLHFALRHCKERGKRRIIVVLPFLSLAEQNTSVYSQIIPEILVDHSQSGLNDDTREFASRWSVPFIITTSVRFFESLFAYRPTDCRKLHNIANSVILFDEAQSLPPEVTRATLYAMNELCRTYHCTVVFSSATQPAYDAIPDLTWKPCEIMPDHPKLYDALKRTNIKWNVKTRTPLSAIAREMAGYQNVCTIVNLRKHARKLFRELKNLCPADEIFFLTTDECPSHRLQKIDQISKRQKTDLPCRVVATQCIEAGVDLDFDAVYRALAPLDSIIQAAGRCNRNGKNPSGGQVTVFLPDEEGFLYPDGWYESAAKLVEQLALDHPIDIHDPAHIREYYQKLLKDQKDTAGLVTSLTKRYFAEVDKNYKLIENHGMQLIVPYCPEGDVHNLYQEIRTEALKNGITPELIKNAAPITVTTSLGKEKLDSFAENLRYASNKGRMGEYSSYYILRPQYEKYYTMDMGLQLPEQVMDTNLW